MNSITDYANVYPVLHDGSAVPGTSYTLISRDAYTVTVNRGDVPYDADNYDLFVDNRGNVFLCLGTLVKAYTYTLVYNGMSYAINNVSYREVADLFDKDVTSTTGVFQFMASTPATLSSAGRCDVSMNGPSVFIRVGETPGGPSVNSLVQFSLGDLRRFTPVLSVDGVGHIIYYEIPSDKEHFATNVNNLPKAARTLFELIRLMAEWSIVADTPWNNSDDQIAAAAKSFLAATGAIPTVVDDAMANQCDMQIARYILGTPNATERPPINEIAPMTSTTKRWLLSNVFHGSVSLFYERIFAAT